MSEREAEKENETRERERERENPLVLQKGAGGAQLSDVQLVL